jgi:hypothetical protein
MAMKRCVSCRSRDVREVREVVEVRVPSSPEPLVVRVTGVSAIKCGGCGESVLSGADLGRSALLAGAEAMARIGTLLDVSPETISRWENGHRAAERSVWNTLADLVADRLDGTDTTLARLKVPRPSIPKQPVRLKLGMAGAK